MTIEEFVDKYTNDEIETNGTTINLGPLYKLEVGDIDSDLPEGFVPGFDLELQDRRQVWVNEVERVVLAVFVTTGIIATWRYSSSEQFDRCIDKLRAENGLETI